MNNLIGKRGEALVAAKISQPAQRDAFSFDPVFLGDRHPTVDYLVHLLNKHGHKAFFFISVKTTTQGYNANKSTLKIKIPIKEIHELARYPVPVYIFGVNSNNEHIYLINANDTHITRRHLSGIPTRFPLNTLNYKKLWKEVALFWDQPSKRFKSHFRYIA